MLRKSTITPTLLLCLVCFGLATIVYWQITGRSDERGEAPAAEMALDQDEAVPGDAGLPVPPREQFATVVARPLFSPNRRPAQQVADAVEPAASEPLDIDLLGIVIWHFQRLAVVRPRNDGAVMQVAVGGMVSGWTVITIEPNRVMFQQGESKREVRLAYKGEEAVANDE